MQYNFHNEKYKYSDIGGIHAEQFREYSDDSKYKNYVDPKRTEQNLYKALSEDGCDWFARINEARDHMEEITGRSLRRDAVVLCSTVESVPTSWDSEVCKEYFQDKAEWYGRYLRENAGVDEGTMLSVSVHLDETTPHATYAWMPLKDEKFQAKNITDKIFLKSLQTDSQDYTMSWIEEYNKNHPEHQIEKLMPAGESKRKHLSEIDYKVEKAKERLGELEAKEEKLTDKVAEQEEKVQEAKWRYEEIVKDITNAPDLETYENVRQENETLREELSLKDRMIERLQENVDHWKRQAEEWKHKFADAIHSAAEKFKEVFGIKNENAEQKPKTLEEVAKDVDDLYMKTNPEEYNLKESIYPGYSYDETVRLLAAGKSDEIMDRIGDGRLAKDVHDSVEQEGLKNRSAAQQSIKI